MAMAVAMATAMASGRAPPLGQTKGRVLHEFEEGVQAQVEITFGKSNWPVLQETSHFDRTARRESWIILRCPICCQ